MEQREGRQDESTRRTDVTLGHFPWDRLSPPEPFGQVLQGDRRDGATGVSPRQGLILGREGDMGTSGAGCPPANGATWHHPAAQSRGTAGSSPGDEDGGGGSARDAISACSTAQSA